MKKTVTKQDQCVKLATDGWALIRIARVLGIGQRQVLRYVFQQTVGKERTRKPLKPKPRRVFYFDTDVSPNFFIPLNQ